MGLETMVWPGVLVVIVGLGIAPLHRRVGHVIGAAATLIVLGWVLVVPMGRHLSGEFLGFDVVFVLVDPASRFMGFIFGVIALLTIVYAYSSDRSTPQTGLSLAYSGLGLGAVFAGDWLSLLVFWELMALASAVLIWSSGGPAVRAGFRYAVVHGLGGLFLLGAVTLQYVSVGSMLFEAHPGMVGGGPALLAVVGIGINVGFVAVHTWIPDAYPKSHFVVSIVLCGFTTKTAVYALYRAFPDGDVAIAYMGGLMALYGVSYALVQTDIRSLLSYHIQSQVGYMVAGIGIGSVLGVAGGFAHLFNNILYKTLLFMVAGVIIYRTGHGDLKKLGGLARLMPVTFVVFLVAAVSIVGVPGFNGYVSKALVKSAAKEEHLEALKWMFTLAGVGTTMSFAKFGYYAFFNGEPDTTVRDAKRGQAVSMGTIAGLCLLLGVNPEPLVGLLPGFTGQPAPPTYTVDQAVEAGAITAVGLAGFLLARRRLASIGTVPDVDVVLNPLAFFSMRAVVRSVGAVTDALGTGLEIGTAGLHSVVSRETRNVDDPRWPLSAEWGGSTRRELARRDLTASLLAVIGLCALGLFVLVGMP
ncbi:MAG: Na(+)/H(+) antiporter subunit D [Halobacteriales archaeon]|nr:Na(+)/H(+) antiporter subunit D [Halobacteriales archaeon]